jgi:hypothetical protein
VGATVELNNEQIKRIRRGLTVNVDVDPDEMGIKKVLVIGVHPGTADLISSLTKEAEVKSAPSVNMDYIKKMNTKEETTKVKDGEYAAESISKSNSSAVIPKVTELDPDMDNFLKSMQEKKKE